MELYIHRKYTRFDHHTHDRRERFIHLRVDEFALHGLFVTSAGVGQKNT